MRYSPYEIPALGDVTLLGVFAPGDEGFFGLERTLDLFRAEGVALVIQLGEALLPRATARSSDVDHLRRLLGQRQQAMLVCTDDLGRAEILRRSGVRNSGARMVRQNITHLDPGFSTRLLSGDSFVVVPADPSPDKVVGLEPFKATDPHPHHKPEDPGGIAVAVVVNHRDLKEATRLLAPRLLISAGPGEFRDDPSCRQGLEDGVSSTRVIVFGQSAGQRISHAIVHLTTGTVTLLPEPSRRAHRRIIDREQLESS